MLNGLDLFSGIGGITVALSPWVHPVAYCENDKYAQSVLLSRMEDGILPHAPIWDDVRTLPYKDIPQCDIIYGGFPCQDISVAGTGRGLDGERSGLFFEIIRLCREIRPRFVFLENVPAITIRGLERILLEFTSLGYDCRWTIVSSAEMGAIHIRKRWFLLAYAIGVRLREERIKSIGWDNTKRNGSMVINNESSAWGVAESSKGFSQPRVDRTGDGLPHRMDRHRGLGNAVVPAQAREAFMRLIGLK